MYFSSDFSPQHEQQETAIKALECVCEHSQDVAQILTALRSVTHSLWALAHIMLISVSSTNIFGTEISFLYLSPLGV